MKYPEQQKPQKPGQSPPSRGAWIEICFALVIRLIKGVAPLAGGVD